MRREVGNGGRTEAAGDADLRSIPMQRARSASLSGRRFGILSGPFCSVYHGRRRPLSFGRPSTRVEEFLLRCELRRLPRLTCARCLRRTSGVLASRHGLSAKGKLSIEP